MHLFYIDTPSSINFHNNTIFLSDDEAKHAFKVLRLQSGDKVQATDGNGNWFECSILDIQKRKCVLTIESHVSEKGKRAYKLHIAVAPTKNIKRFEWFLEKATEMGIDEITPIISYHSERRVFKRERSNAIITSAVKQSLKAYHPILNEAVDFNTFIKEINGEELYIAHLIDENQQDLKNAYKPQQDVCVLIGPEGDFSGQEVEEAVAKGFKAVKMGTERLRTETAALVACGMIHFVND